MSTQELPYDVSDTIVSGYFSILRKQMDPETWMRQANDRKLAEAATETSVARIVAFLTKNTVKLGPPGLLLAVGIEQHASALNDLGRNEMALALYDCIAQMYELRAPDEMKAMYRNHRGVVLKAMGRFDEALPEFDRAIALRESLLSGGRWHNENSMARALMNRSNTFLKLGRIPDAIADAERAIGIFERLLAGGHPELADDLEQARANRTGLLEDLK